MEELLTIHEAAKILKVHPNTLRIWDNKGILKAIRIGEKQVRRYKKEDLEKFIAPLREKRKEFAKDIPKALAILKAGGEKAKKVASAKMDEVREKIGVSVY